MIRFLLTFGLLDGISRWPFFISEVREPYCQFLARSLEVLLGFTHLNPLRIDSSLSAGFGGSFKIIPTCDGLVLAALFLAGVAAAPIQRKLKPYLWVLASLAILTMINWLRLLALTLTAFYNPDFFDLVHIYVAQGVLIIAVVMVFMVWLSGTEPRETV